jgi:hypothetical protein
MAQTFMDGASSFFGKKVDDTLPGIVNAAMQIIRIDQTLRIEFKKRQ